jgi:hypothetical protein
VQKTIIAAPAAARILVKTALLSGLLTAFVPGVVLADPIPKSVMAKGERYKEPVALAA